MEGILIETSPFAPIGVFAGLSLLAFAPVAILLG
jgi:hypothetical protein